jgi:hypothetical protein
MKRIGNGGIVLVCLGYEIHCLFDLILEIYVSPQEIVNCLVI